MLIIAFGHRSRTGKNTACMLAYQHIIKTNPSLRAKIVSFASELKRVAFQLFGYLGLKDEVHYENYPEDRYKIIPTLGVTPIELWVSFGNKIREIYPDTWADLVLNSNKHNEILLVSDLRYPNEFNCIKKHNSLCIKITRDSVPVLDTIADKALDSWGMWDKIITNDGSLNELNEKVIEAVDIALNWRTVNEK